MVIRLLFKQRLLNQIWYAQPSVIVLIQATPAVGLRILAEAAKPSTQRLHLRNLFTEGRRYYLHPLNGGFQMNSSSKAAWQQRKRSRVAAVLFGKFSDAGAGITRLHLTTRMTLSYMLDVFIIPLWMGTLLIFGPISRTTAVAFIIILLGLSWLWHRYNAMLQATEMIYFIQVALEDLMPAEIPVLSETTDNMVYSDFQSQWDKFYEQHKSDEKQQ